MQSTEEHLVVFYEEGRTDIYTLNAKQFATLKEVAAKFEALRRGRTVEDSSDALERLKVAMS